MPLSTQHRMFLLRCPLGEDALLVRGVQGREALSRPFEFSLDLISDRDDIQPEDVIGKRSTLCIETMDGERHFTGLMSRFSRVGATPAPEGAEGEFYAYECDLVPWLWFMLQHEDSRIFQDKSIPDIVEEVFKQFQFTDYELRLSGEHPPLTYCAQYRETNFAFISRLLERAGIYYFFRHEPESETLVLTDNRDHNPRLEPDALPFHDLAMAEASDCVTALKRRERIHTGRVVLRDYDFERPSTDLEISVDSLVHIGDNSNYERFVHPGGYTDRALGEGLARVMIESEEADQDLLDATSDVRTLMPGHVFGLERHPEDALNEDYLVVAVEHRGRNNLGSDQDSGYDNRFSMIPHRVQYRAPLATRKAHLRGPQTAVVVGPPGEEIHTDKYGRVKVKFRWDRTPTADDKSSCWLRVAQMWAGKQWGAMFVPRIGMEVLVDFLEGDPDQPIVVGCLYNGENMPPYALPAEATKSTFKTYSSKGGEGFNEVRFEDKKGEEQLFLHAQKDMDVRVGKDRREWVENDRSLVVKRDRLEETHRSHHSFVKKDRIGEIEGDDHLSLKGKQAIRIAGSKSLKVDGAVGESFQSHSEQVATNYYLNAGANVVIEAGVMLTLKVGGNHVTISPAGVAIVGAMVLVNSGGAPASGSAASLVPPLAVTAATAAANAKPGQKPEASPLGDKRPGKPPDRSNYDPDSDENKDKTHWIEVELVDESGRPVAGERVQITLPDGSISGGTTDEKGLLKVANIDPGDCQIGFPDLDKDAWE
ncbi:MULTISPECIES: type VI secretion system tip protein TssI/VgrG [unclassified Lysobacter]|uniref:type VI secretion system tip protein TssI/VgrG n=1 Tax=unclassified Lysobacter TaxID=2635362 RepID=UPI001BED35E3|nr:MULTISPECIES: type VI secretion system tip protein TssI/VgrG [unclassified Lysobacter]MBT2744824.1 type VI secretion system tip protein VgrG [Lysobacter sp. ISL-42]MBT2752183.1 type VI secretion system tip protein VgrG [Lysobacter sp. ISL-50]MBT2778680.1 type VI secretion system tip protein VgrG [Lysobacter sp. ISL-54]MBT2780389.1 type VI secretion system tip protein VgrG [Lysobacter sp. ISL-52]